MSERADRVARTALQILGEALPRLLAEDLYPLITLTGAEVSGDLSFIDIRVQVAASGVHGDVLYQRLLEYKPRMQTLIARGLRSRKTPRLRLHRDRSLDYSEKIGELIDEIHGGDETEEV
jgi:ribosome-binding factor A